MRFNQIYESKMSVGIIFGRFNPPHKGHRNAWKLASKCDNWYIGTYSETIGPKNPLPFDVKIQAMLAIWPNIQNHIVSTRTWLYLASYVYEKHGDVSLHYFTDEEWVGEALNKYNGIKSEHGYYNFNEIILHSTPRISSSTTLRNAILSNNREEFYIAAGISSDVEIMNKNYFDLVNEYLSPYVNKKKKTKKTKESITGGSPEALKPGTGTTNYVSQKPKEFENMKAEDMLPKKAFAGTEAPWNHKLGIRGQLRNQKRGAKAGDLVGGGAENISSKEKSIKENNWHRRSLKKVVQDIIDYIGDNPSDSAIIDAATEEAKLSGFSNQEIFDAVYDRVRGTVSESNKLVKIGEEFEQQIHNAISLLENKIYEDVSLSKNKNYGQQKSYGPCNIFVSNEKYNGLYFIAVAEHPRTNVALFKNKGNTKQEALNNLYADIDSTMSKHSKISGYAVVDFNREFVFKILNSPDEKFYAKIVSGPSLILAGPELADFPEYAKADGFKESNIRMMLSREGSTPFPSIQLSPTDTKNAELINNGRYILGPEQKDKDGNRIFNLTFDSTVIDKNEKIRIKVPALTVGTRRQ